MSLIEIGLFYLGIMLITALQSVTAYIYFSGFFVFRFGGKLFLVFTFIYMFVIKFFPEVILLRMILLLIFLLTLALFSLFGSFEKKVYHVLSFTFSLTLCELAFSMVNGENGMDIQTQYLKWLVVYFLINILFFLFVIAVIKILMYFREENNEGLTDREYLLLSIIPLASLIIIYASTGLLYIFKIISCICLIFINLSYIVIYDRIAKKNYEIHRFSVIEEQNHYYQERIQNQQELARLRHDLKNILITIDSLVTKNDTQAAKEQISNLLEIKALCYDEFTGCVALDSILNVKILKIKENNIDYNLKVQMPSDLKIKDNNILDVSAILGNLLDNAIEAELRIENGKEKKIDIVIQYDNGKLIINLQNTSNQLLTDFSNTLIRSEKGKERFGIGISSIKERVDRLNGYYDFKYEEGLYTALIVLPI